MVGSSPAATLKVEPFFSIVRVNRKYREVNKSLVYDRRKKVANASIIVDFESACPQDLLL